MSDRPGVIVEVQPVNVATFQAVQYDTMFGGDEALAALSWLAQRYGWKVQPGEKIMQHGRITTGVLLIGKNNRRYKVTNGDWVIALGSNGSLRVVSDKQYRKDYREV